MSRPPEYENLIRTGALAAVQPTPGAAVGFLKNARSFLALAKTLLTGSKETVAIAEQTACCKA